MVMKDFSRTSFAELWCEAKTLLILIGLASSYLIASIRS